MQVHGRLRRGFDRGALNSVALALGPVGCRNCDGVAHRAAGGSWRMQPKPGSFAGRLTMKLIAMLSTPRVESKAIRRM